MLTRSSSIQLHQDPPPGFVSLVDCLPIGAYNVTLYTIALSPLPPSFALLSWCHVTDRLHGSYFVSPGHYVCIRQPPISCPLINQHFPRSHMSHKLSASPRWSCSAFSDCQLKEHVIRLCSFG